MTPEQARSEWMRRVVQEHEGPLARYVARITGDVERARDVVQGGFLKLWNEPNWRELEPRVAPWLFTVCRRMALDVRRKESRMSSLGDSPLEDRAGREPAPDEACQQREAYGQVLAALGDLPENQQEVLRLKFQNGFSYREISGVTNLSTTNVGYLIHTGLKALRGRLARPQLAAE